VVVTTFYTRDNENFVRGVKISGTCTGKIAFSRWAAQLPRYSPSLRLPDSPPRHASWEETLRTWFARTRLRLALSFEGSQAPEGLVPGPLPGNLKKEDLDITLYVFPGSMPCEKIK
jgi:hypothetical protein